MFFIGMAVFAVAVLISIAWHECGHMWAAQATGMRVRRYFVGFGPRIWSTTRKGTEYGFKAIPLGGFCDIAGMYAIDDVHPDDEPQAMYRQKVWKRVFVLLAGPFMNFLAAIVVILIAAVLVGLPTSHGVVVSSTGCVAAKQISKTQLSPCTGQGPAYKAGLQPGDIITGVNGQENLRNTDVLKQISTSSGPLHLIVKRGDQIVRITSGVEQSQRFVVNPKTGAYATDPDGHIKTHTVSAIGIRFTPIRTVPMREMVPAAWEFTSDLAVRSWQGLIAMPSKVSSLWHALWGGKRDLNSPTSIYGAAIIGGDLAKAGQWYSFTMLLISLNFFLGLFNLLPLLPLDGGHIAVAVFEKLRSFYRSIRRLPQAGPVDFTKLAPITLVFLFVGGMYMLLALGADIFNPIRL